VSDSTSTHLSRHSTEEQRKQAISDVLEEMLGQIVSGVEPSFSQAAEAVRIDGNTPSKRQILRWMDTPEAADAFKEWESLARLYIKTAVYPRTIALLDGVITSALKSENLFAKVAALKAATNAIAALEGTAPKVQNNLTLILQRFGGEVGLGERVVRPLPAPDAVETVDAEWRILASNPLSPQVE
jgi:hypothetical protein